MIEIDGRVLADAGAIAAWFTDAAASRDGVKAWHDDVGETLAEQPYSLAVAEAIVRVMDAGPTAARAAACTYLRLRPVDAPVLKRAWTRWVDPPVAWLDDVGSSSGAKMGSLLAWAAEQCGVATDPDVSAAFVRLADRYGTHALWARAIAHADPRGRGVDALSHGIARGVRPGGR